MKLKKRLSKASLARAIRALEPYEGRIISDLIEGPCLIEEFTRLIDKEFLLCGSEDIHEHYTQLAMLEAWEWESYCRSREMAYMEAKEN